MNNLVLDPPTPFGYTHIGIFIVQRLAIILHHINVALIARLFITLREDSRLFGSAFAIQSPLQDLANIEKDMTF
jgi:hypothetical protein